MPSRELKAYPKIEPVVYWIREEIRLQKINPTRVVIQQEKEQESSRYIIGGDPILISNDHHDSDKVDSKNKIEINSDSN